MLPVTAKTHVGFGLFTPRNIAHLIRRDQRTSAVRLARSCVFVRDVLVRRFGAALGLLGRDAEARCGRWSGRLGGAVEARPEHAARGAVGMVQQHDALSLFASRALVLPERGGAVRRLARA